MSSRFVVCDIETTGLHENREPIEIALITVENGMIVDKYETLINPLQKVSDFVLNLTSISQRELNEAPKFYEISDSILLRLENSIFVSHNVDFDLGVLKKKFHEMGIELKLNSYCTLKRSIQVLPELKSYTLDSLCHLFRIKIKLRHRAYDDAFATYLLFQELSNLDVILSKRSENIENKMIENLPAQAGILIFLNEQGDTLLKKSTKNLKEEAKLFFSDRKKNLKVFYQTKSLTYELTGTNLLAQFKLNQFKTFRPKWGIELNKKRDLNQFNLKSYDPNHSFLWVFEKKSEALQKLKFLRRQHTHEKMIYQDGDLSKDQIIKRNLKNEELARQALFPSDDLIIFGPGRKLKEMSLVLVRNQQVVGYGYSERSTDEVLSKPDSFIIFRFKRPLYFNLLALRYLKELKNDRKKTEFWRALPSKIKDNDKRFGFYDSLQI